MNPRAPALQPPPLTRLGWEALSGLEVARLAAQSHRLARARRGHAPVIVLPGFGADDLSTVPLRSFLRRLGHEVEGWTLGRNGGNVQALLPRVAERVRILSERRAERVHLIGQSLGGVLARELARDEPARVAQVITLGTPVVGGPTYTRVGFAYDPAQQERIAATVSRRNRIPIGVPVTAVYSRRDGIVAWQACIDHDNPQVEHVEVSSSHFGMGIDPDVWLLSAKLLVERARRR